MATKIRGAQIKVAYAGSGLGVSGNIMSVNVDDSSIEIPVDTLQVKALGITNAMLAGSITDSKLASSYIYADGTRAFTGTVSGVDPTVDAHLTTKGYVDGELTTVSGDLINEIIWEVVDTPTVQIRPKAAHMGKAIYTSGNVTVGGDLTVTGTLFYTNTETVQISDNTLILNYGESGAGVTAVTAGIEIDRGSETDYWFVFDERNDTFRVGVSGSTDAFNDYELQPVATREDTPINMRVSWWESSSNTFRNQGDTYITVNSGSDTLVMAVSDTTELTVGTGGIALKDSTVDVNEILNTADADSIGPASTDDQLATAKLIYNTIDTVSGSVLHNNRPDLQGGNGSDEYYHLTADEYDNTMITTVSGDTGSATPVLGNFVIVGGEGMDTSATGKTVTITGEDAEEGAGSANKGIASFEADDFLVVSGHVSISTTGSGVANDYNGDTGTANPSGGDINFFGGEGMNTSATGNTVTIAGEDAADGVGSANKGICSFESDDFTVTTGHVVIAAAGVDNAQLANTSVNYSAGVGLGGGGAATLGGATVDFNVNVDDSTIEIPADTLQVKDSGITEAKLDMYNSPTASGQVIAWNDTQSKMEWIDIDTEINAVTEGDIQMENESANCNGATTAFTLSYTPVTNSLQVYLNGLLQEKGNGLDYTLSGVTVTFHIAPEINDILLIHYIAIN